MRTVISRDFRYLAYLPQTSIYSMSGHFTVLAGTFEVNELDKNLVEKADPRALYPSSSNYFSVTKSINGTTRKLHASTVWNLYAIDVKDNSHNVVRFEPLDLAQSPVQIPDAGLPQNIFSTSSTTLSERNVFGLFFGQAPDNPLLWSQNERKRTAQQYTDEFFHYLPNLPDHRYQHIDSMSSLVDSGLNITAFFGLTPTSLHPYSGFIILSEPDPLQLNSHTETERILSSAKRDFDPHDPVVCEAHGRCGTCQSTTRQVPVNYRDQQGNYVMNVKRCTTCNSIYRYDL